jgi:hypothetical protein
VVSEFNSAVLNYKAYAKYLRLGEEVSFPEEIIGKFKQVYNFCCTTNDNTAEDKKQELKTAVVEYLNLMGAGATIETALTTHAQPTNIERIPLKDIPGFDERLNKVGLSFALSLHSLLNNTTHDAENSSISEERLKSDLLAFAGAQQSATVVEMYNRITEEITNTWPKSHVLVLCNLLGCNVLMPGR